MSNFFLKHIYIKENYATQSIDGPPCAYTDYEKRVHYAKFQILKKTSRILHQYKYKLYSTIIIYLSNVTTVRDDECFGGRVTQFCDCTCYLGLFAGDNCTGMR